jgi:glycosyltransferase involved in cell wall biosynthesis
VSETAGPASPQLAVAIPTRNSARTLRACIESVLAEPASVEVIVADAGSTDGTCELARSLGARVIDGRLPLLEARYQGFRASTAPTVLLLDSDQLVEAGTLGRILEELASHDALILEETSVEGGSWLTRLFAADKRYLHAARIHRTDAVGGSLLARAFRHEALEAAFATIPPRVRLIAGGYDHAILAQAVSEVTSSVGLVRAALRHHELVSFRDFWRKNFRWGRGLAELFAEAPQYRALASAKAGGRLRRSGAPWGDFVRSLSLMAIKVPPYAVGYTSASLARKLHRRAREASAVGR